MFTFHILLDEENHKHFDNDFLLRPETVSLYRHKNEEEEDEREEASTFIRNI